MSKLIVPLKEKFFEMFKDGRKRWEFRGVSSKFNRETVRRGRKVELRKGYTKEALEGMIEEVKTVEGFEKLPENVKKSIVPENSIDDFLEDYRERYDEFIAFKVELKD